MYRTKEVRWFGNDADKSILDWFARQGLTFENTESRTDFYFPLQKEDIAIKLREGNIEIKHRIGDTLKAELKPKVTGIFENWVKWSFTADKNDNLSQEIISHNPYNWIVAVKTRMGVKLANGSNDNLQILPIKTFLDAGCQVEYTLLKINDQTLYTFALEWFGNKKVFIPADILNNIFGSAQLNAEDSMGYGKKLVQILS